MQTPGVSLTAVYAKKCNVLKYDHKQSVHRLFMIGMDFVTYVWFFGCTTSLPPTHIWMKIDIPSIHGHYTHIYNADV